MSATPCPGSGKPVVYGSDRRWICPNCGGSWPARLRTNDHLLVVWEDLAPEHEPMTREGKLREAAEAVRVAIGMTPEGQDGELQMALVCLENALRGGDPK